MGQQVLDDPGAVMKKLFLAGAAVIAMAAATASAADLPAKPVYKAAPPVVAPLPFSWTGFYVGGSAGYGWGRDGDVDLSATGTPVVPIPGPGTLETTAANVAAIPTVLRIHPKGFFGGGQIGYNYQAYLFVFGIEADFSGADIRGAQAGTGSAPIIGFFPPDVVTATASASQKLDFLGTVRARLGFTPIDRVLIYGTGGFAYGHVRSSTTVSEVETPPATVVTDTVANGSASGMRAGWAAGGGLEWAFAPRWSIKAEYLYYDLGRLTYATSPIVGTSFGFSQAGTVFGTVNIVASTEFKGSIARAGVNFHF